MIGRVISTRLKNTATVLVERMAKHPLYKKSYIQSKKYLVDSTPEIKEGDIVEFINCKPISKRKVWKITKVLGRSFAEIAEERLKEQAEEIIAEVMPEEKEESRVKSLESSEEKVSKDKKIVNAKKPRKEKSSH